MTRGAARAADRERMIQEQLVRRGVQDPRVLDAFRAVPRELFVRPDQTAFAYDDAAMPIDAGQTISQPYVVGVMLQALDVRPGERVLEVGAGSGYVTAILAHLTDQVRAMEWHPELARQAVARLASLGIRTVELRVGDGSLGWPEGGPFDAILVSAGGPRVPPALVDQLAPGGRLLMPVGSHDAQELLLLTRGHDGGGLTERRLDRVVFVPLLSSGG